MTSPQVADSENIFSSAIELPVEQRDVFVREQCGDDSALLNEVNLLLQHHQQNESNEFILDRPHVSELLKAAKEVDIGEKAGDTIGQYRLLERIGEGGMGVVYMAEQLSSVHRKVALKIIKLGMDTRHVVARFEAERQALALFDHPNIARVFDAGATESGRPFFVMELIRGTSIIEYVEKTKLPLRERLTLFVKVCNAVQHAHQKGIIHRDLKPSNILVTQLDGAPAPKVIDFGIAKAMGQPLTDKTVFTRFSAMIGTPHYMSPEQAELNGTDVDTRSDIYSLGVILYELLTGTTPIEKKKLKNLHPGSLFETIRNAEIETPSTRIEKVETSENAQQVSHVVSRQVKNELDWVVMKALAQDRKQRYASANELAADIKRFLEGDPVAAAPPVRFYKARAIIRKYRNAALFGVGVSVLLMVSTIVSTILAVQGNQLNRQLKNALQEKSANLSRAESAESELKKTLELQKFEEAHALAFAKFGQQFYGELAGEYEQLDSEPVEMSILAGGEIAEIETDVLFCIHFDWSWLLEFKSVAASDLPLQKLKTYVARIKSQEKELDSHFSQSIANEGELKNIPILEHEEHSPLCLKLQEQTRARMHLYRPKFYRTLVKEYRRKFGHRNERVRDALVLLAVSLIDVAKLDEAESRVREAMVLNNTDDTSLERKLLLLINRKRKRQPANSRDSNDK